MTNTNCPYGRLYCDGCNHLTTAGCSVDTSSFATTWTSKDAKEYYNHRHQELMNLSKETLVEIIMGQKPIFF